MRATVSVSELKSRLSYYLRQVRSGGEVQILDRGVPVACLVGLREAADDPSGRRARLVASGVLRPGTGDASFVLDEAPLQLNIDLTGAIDEERAEKK